jgi:microcystin-dependent protein
MSVFGLQGFLLLEQKTIENSNGLQYLSNNYLAFSNEVVDDINLLSNAVLSNSNSININSNLIAQNATEINTIKTVDIFLLNSNVDVIYDIINDNSNNIETRLLKTEYETLEEQQNTHINNVYLSKQEFENYKTNLAIENFIEGGIGNIANAALEEAQLATFVLGSTLISTGVTLAGQIYNTVEDAFLNLDGRVIANCNSITTLENQYEFLESSLNTKVENSVFTSSNIQTSNSIVVLSNQINDRYTKQEVDYLFADTINGATFNSLKTAISFSNIRYDTEIGNLSNVVDTKADLTIFTSNTQATNLKINDRVLQTVYNSNTQATNLKINDRVLQTVYNSNTQATNIKINDRVLQTVYNSNTQATNLKIAEIDNSSGYTKEETDELLDLKENKATIITNVEGGCNTWLLTSTINNMIEPTITLLPEIHFEERLTPFFTTTSNIVLPSDWNSNEWLLSASSTVPTLGDTATPDNAMRQFGSTEWSSDGISDLNGYLNEWWQIQYPCDVYIQNFNFGTDISFVTAPLEFQLQYSDDGMSFTTLQDYITSTWGFNTIRNFEVTNPVSLPYRWWRIQINRISSGFDRVSIHRLSFNCLVPHTLIPPVLVSNNQFKLTLADSIGYVLQNTTKSITFDIIVQTTTGDIYKGSYIISNGVVINKTEQIIQSLEILGINTFTLSYANSIALKIFNTIAGSFSSQIDTIKRVIRDLITPVGCIIIWSGNINNIPVGWAICDGQIINGFTTPDLRGRFVICSGVGYDSGTTGGSATQTLTISNMPAHTHTGTTAGGGAHGHNFNYSTSGGSSVTVGGDSTGANNRTQNTNSVANHTHTFTTNSTGSGTAFSIVPQYYSLIYIVKV